VVQGGRPAGRHQDPLSRRPDRAAEPGGPYVYVRRDFEIDWLFDDGAEIAHDHGKED